jgi:quercetin dioxygenase-like cupin family protein
VRILDVGPATGREVTHHGSVGFRAVGLVSTESTAVTALHIAPGGQIGRHPATVDQLFIVVAGSGEVCGGDDVFYSVHVGQAVLWRAGEEHTTRASADGLTAIGVEMDNLGL